MVWNINPEPPQDRAHLLDVIGRYNRRARSHRRRIVTWDIGNDVGDQPGGRSGQRQLAALYRRKGLADRVHRTDRGTRAQKLARYILLVGKGNAMRGHGQQRGGAARYQNHDEIVRPCRVGQFHDIAGRLEPCLVGHRMSGLDDGDVARGDRMAIARDNQSLDRRIPGLFESAGHAGRSLASAQNYGPPLGPLGQNVLELTVRQRRLKGSVEETPQHGFGVQIADFVFSKHRRTSPPLRCAHHTVFAVCIWPGARQLNAQLI